MDEHKSKIVHKLVETLCLVMETPDSKIGKISEDIVPKSTFTSLKEGMDMEEKDSIFSKMKLGEDKSKSKSFSLDIDKEGKPEDKSLMDMKDKPLMYMKDKDSIIPQPEESLKGPFVMNADTRMIGGDRRKRTKRKSRKRQSRKRLSRRRRR